MILAPGILEFHAHRETCEISGYRDEDKLPAFILVEVGDQDACCGANGQSRKHIRGKMLHALDPVVPGEGRGNDRQPVEDEFFRTQFRVVIAVNLGNEETCCGGR